MDKEIQKNIIAGINIKGSSILWCIVYHSICVIYYLARKPIPNYVFFVLFTDYCMILMKLSGIFSY